MILIRFNLCCWILYFSRKTLARSNVFVCFFVLYLFNPIVCAQTLSAKIDAVIEQQLPHAIVGIQVKDAKTGTMHDVSSLSGYIINPNKNTLIFLLSSMELTHRLALQNLRIFVPINLDPFVLRRGDNPVSKHPSRQKSCAYASRQRKKTRFLSTNGSR